MLLTFEESKASHELSSIAGVCTTGDTFKALLNQATRKLMRRGDFWGTVQRVKLCVWNHCIVWPQWVGRISAYRNSFGPRNFWEDFLPLSGGDICGVCDSDFHSIEQSGTVPVYRQIECEAKYLRVFIDRQADIGKKATFFGVDYNGQPIRTQRADGTFRDGMELTFAMPYVTSPFTVKGVSRVVKDVTEGPVRLYQWDSTHDVLLDMAVYSPEETSPSYRFTSLHKDRSRCTCPAAIEVLVKLQFIPVKHDLDRVLIENLDALQMMISSIKLIEQGDPEGARAMEVEAVRELNLEIRDRFPSDQTAVSASVFGHAPLSRVTGGFI